MGAQNIVKEIKQYQKKWLQHVQRMDTNRIPKQAYSIDQKDKGTLDDRRRDGATNFNLRTKYKIYNWQSKHNKFVVLCCSVCYTTTCFSPFLGHLHVVSA